MHAATGVGKGVQKGRLPPPPPISPSSPLDDCEKVAFISSMQGQFGAGDRWSVVSNNASVYGTTWQSCISAATSRNTDLNQRDQGVTREGSLSAGLSEKNAVFELR